MTETPVPDWVQKLIDAVPPRKLSKRDRYVFKWNGPNALRHRKKVKAACRRTMGHGDETTRICATAYVCRFQGWFPKSEEAFAKSAGV